MSRSAGWTAILLLATPVAWGPSPAYETPKLDPNTALELVLEAVGGWFQK